jgi:hypothetical protein
VDVVLYAKKILTIEHHIGTVNGVKSAALVGRNPNTVLGSENPKSERLQARASIAALLDRNEVSGDPAN